LAGVSNDGKNNLTAGPPINLFNASTVDGQTGGALEYQAQLAGLHTNLYTNDRQYDKQNMSYPLSTLQTDFAAIDKPRKR
jgi:hypothetical protein